MNHLQTITDSRVRNELCKHKELGMIGNKLDEIFFRIFVESKREMNLLT